MEDVIRTLILWMCFWSVYIYRGLKWSAKTGISSIISMIDDSPNERTPKENNKQTALMLIVNANATNEPWKQALTWMNPGLLEWSRFGKIHETALKVHAKDIWCQRAKFGLPAGFCTADLLTFGIKSYLRRVFSVSIWQRFGSRFTACLLYTLSFS